MCRSYFGWGVIRIAGLMFDWMRGPKRAFIGFCGLGYAGAVSAGACVLCAAGTYQTGSGPPRQQGSHGSEAMRIVCGVHAMVQPGKDRRLSDIFNQHIECSLLNLSVGIIFGLCLHDTMCPLFKSRLALDRMHTF